MRKFLIQFLPVSWCRAGSCWCFHWLFCSFLLLSCTSRSRFRRCCRWCWSDGCRCGSGSQSRGGRWGLSHSCCRGGTNCGSSGRIWLLRCCWCWCCHCFGLNTLKSKMIMKKYIITWKYIIWRLHSHDATNTNTKLQPAHNFVKGHNYQHQHLVTLQSS